ncbi:MAG: TIGR04283 family arsenosugar biosynthesis glycosyltransferase [Magnetococcales bacterium]|nr:TIGR04283 family arsenosugar biosynthesis glycosyltransferase [Magnetococcales bacterium]
METTDRPQLSIIIPTWNETGALPGLIAQLQRQRGLSLEILVADGGSTDDTRAVAQAAGVRVIACPERGRGAQMNVAASRATGPMLLFLHADSGLTDPEQLQRALAHLAHQQARLGNRCAGHFQIRFVDPSGDPPWILRYFEAKSALNRPECVHGDQGMLLSRAFFAEIGGFQTELPYLEDQHLSRAVARLGQWITLPGRLESSARRFRQEGVTRRILLNAMILIGFYADFPEFLQHAPVLYRTQDHAAPLRLLPFLRLIHTLDQAAGRKAAWRRWHRIGRQLRCSLWQLFFIGDLLFTQWLLPNRHPMLAFHDRVVQPTLDFTPCDWGCAILARLGVNLPILHIAPQKSIC